MSGKKLEKAEKNRKNYREEFPKMSEIRKHYFLPEYCIIAEERGKRPSDFADEAGDMGQKGQRSGPENCAFCGGAEEKTPPAGAVYKEGRIFADTKEKIVRKWDFRCFQNLFPALSPIPAFSELSGVGEDASPGFGFHEVIVESPVHGKKLSDFSAAELSDLMQVYRDRVCHYRAHESIRYVSLFKNSGEAAGASLDHAHSQLLALPLLPPLLKTELQAIGKEEKCPYCALLEKEKKSTRFIRENRECVAFTPYCSKSPFEVWVLPKKHVSYLGDCSKEILSGLGEMIGYVLNSYGKVLGNPAYNYMFYQLFDSPEYHLNLRFLPRISLIAGFEMNTGIYINTISPERAASYLRGDRPLDE